MERHREAGGAEGRGCDRRCGRVCEGGAPGVLHPISESELGRVRIPHSTWDQKRDEKRCEV